LTLCANGDSEVLDAVETGEVALSSSGAFLTGDDCGLAASASGIGAGVCDSETSAEFGTVELCARKAAAPPFFFAIDLAISASRLAPL